MEIDFLKKYFSVGDNIEVRSLQSTHRGILVDLSVYAIAIEDNNGNPMIFSLDNIVECKKVDVINISDAVISKEEAEDTEKARQIDKCISMLESIFEQFSIEKDTVITTNAVVIENTKDGVFVQTDFGQKVKCAKPSFVGYSRDNAAVGKRVYCKPSNNDVSYMSLAEMNGKELYDRFVKAILVKPNPRFPIINSIVGLLKDIYGNQVIPQAKKLKEATRELKQLFGELSETTISSLRVEDLTDEQLQQVAELIKSKKSDIAAFELRGEKIKFVDDLICENYGYRLKRHGIVFFVENIDKLDDVNWLRSNNSSTKPIEDSFVPANCEIYKYFHKFHNGLVSNTYDGDIRFKEADVLDDDLKLNLANCWTTPIPVICVYKSVGNRKEAILVTKPGSTSEIRKRVTQLREQSYTKLADILEAYIEGPGSGKVQIANIESSELYVITREQRMIKNFEDAEKGFIELINRKYNYDRVVRDLAMMYQEWKEIPKAIALLEEHLPYLSDQMKSYNTLFTIYHSHNMDADAIRVMEQALLLYPGDDRRSVLQKAKINQKIELVKKKKKKANYTSEDIPAALLRYDINNTSGEVLAYISDKSFDDKLQYLNQRIGELKNSPELPSYYLAKIQLLGDNGETGDSPIIKNLLADYCRAKARNFFSAGNEVSAREYLLQGILVSNSEELYYLLYDSLCEDPQVVLTKYNTALSGYDKTLVLKETSDVLYTLMQIFSRDTLTSRKLYRVVFEGASLSWISGELDINIGTPENLIAAIKDVARNNAIALTKFEESLDAILELKTLNEISTKLIGLNFPGIRQINKVDAGNISVMKDIANLILDINQGIDYDRCDELSRDVFGKIDSVISKIDACPTNISTLRVKPLLLKYRVLLGKFMELKYSESIPKVEIEAIGDAHCIGDNVEIQISISNAVGSSRVNNGVLKISSINGKEVEFIYKIDGPLNGGEKNNWAFTIKQSLVSSDNVTIKYSFEYLDVRKIEREYPGQIKIAVNKGDDYEDFENPYIAHVKSNAVKDKSMFKGRDEIIDTICKYVLEDNKGYVLYGQKRSGKSSVLYHITQKLRAEKKAFAVEYTMGNNIVQDSESESESMANLFYTIISEIGRAIKEVDREVYRTKCSRVRRHEFDNHPTETFKEKLDEYLDIIKEDLQYEQEKIILIIDEFTYLYYHILEGLISERLMEFWKALIESGRFSFVFAGQDAMPRFMDAYQNVFASMHPHELTYIDEVSARELIEQPIWNSEKNCSRYHPDAVDLIIELTACSPFYIMILCSELVKFARQRKRLPIQVSDVEALVQRMICNESSISRKDFDNLISCGESRLDIIDKDDSIRVLKDIAVKSRHLGGFYDVSAIDVFDPCKVKTIIDELLRRGVLERHKNSSNKVKIKVGLFNRWLLNHE